MTMALIFTVEDLLWPRTCHVPVLGDFSCWLF